MMVAIPVGFKYTAAFMAGRPQHARFDSFSLKHPRMERGKRAKIFAPFDALDGYSESIDEKNVEYVERIEIEVSEKAELNRRLEILRGLTYNGKVARKNSVKVSVRYYVPCTDKNHFAYQMKGQYIVETGICWKVDPEVTGTMTVGDVIIPLCDVIEITAADEAVFEEDEWEPC